MKRFIKFISKTILHQLVSLFVMIILSLALIEIVISGISTKIPKEVQEKSFLVVDLDLDIFDSPKELMPDEILEALLSGEEKKQVYLYEVLNAISTAAKDPKIHGMLITGTLKQGSSSNGMSTIHEVLAEINRFKSQGKPVVGYIENPSLTDYLLYSTAEPLFINPMGSIMLQGMAAQVLYMGDALSQFGIQIQAPRSGRYKSAVEPFTRNNMSDENRMQLEALLSDRWDIMTARYSSNRGIELEELRKIIKSKAIFNSQEAISNNLADQEAYFDEVIDFLVKSGSPDEDNLTFEQVSLETYLHNIRSLPTTEKDNKIAVVYIEGAIVDGENAASKESVSGKAVARELRLLRKEKEAKGVVLRVNSPGGSAFASEEIQRELGLLRAEGIPVVTSFGSIAASGGYWVATESDRILTQPATITGSIGVFGMIPNIQKLANRYGFNWETVKTEEYADIFSIARPKTEEELEKIQVWIDDIYTKFLERVANARDLSIEEVKELADGRVWSGQDAVDIGLADKLGGLNEAIAECALLAQIDDWEVTHLPEAKDSMDLVEEILQGSSISLEKPSPMDIIRKNRNLSKIRKELEFLQLLQDARGAYALFPYILN